MKLATTFVLFLALLAPIRLQAKEARLIAGYSVSIPPETVTERAARHVAVAQRRGQAAILIAHRGLCTMTRENTLDAYAAAMDYGADGCEVDVRRTRDGVLVLFHDDMLDRLTDCFGQVEDLSYAELLALRPQRAADTVQMRPPTFAALLTLARQRAMLLLLDAKATGLEDDIAQLLDEADAWDHVVGVNVATAPKLRQHFKLKPLPGKGGIYEHRRDVDPAAVRAALTNRGQILMLEDPRVAAAELKRPPFQPVPLPKEVFASWRLETGAETKANAKSVSHLLSQLATVREENLDAGAILRRAQAAEQLGWIRKKNARVIAALEQAVAQPTLHTNWLFCGLDRHCAVRALARLGSASSAPKIIAAFQITSPDAAKFRHPAWTNSPLSWVDWRKMEMISALGDLRGDAAKSFLLAYVRRTEEEAKAWSIPQFEEATQALCQHRLTRREVLMLLQSGNASVRGRAILECLDRPGGERTAALREAASWALKLPKGRTRY